MMMAIIDPLETPKPSWPFSGSKKSGSKSDPRVQ